MKKAMVSVLIFLIVTSVTIASNLDKVKDAIKEKGASWKAGETSVSRLSEHEQRELLGVIPDEHIDRANLAPGNGKNNRTPKDWDWRDVNGQNWVTPVKSQGGCGSCWAFGSVAQLESALMIASGNPEQLDLSEQYLVSCDSGSFGCGGSYMYSAYNFLRDTGVPDELCYKYIGKDAKTGAPCENACPEPIMYSSAGWQHIGGNVNTFKAAIYQNPITVAFRVYQDFFYYTGGVYKYVWGKLLGGHAICIVGYVHKEHSFICKNSWGDKWGENGYFRIAFTEMENEVAFGMYAARFEVASGAPGRYETTLTVWAKMKESL